MRFNDRPEIIRVRGEHPKAAASGNGNNMDIDDSGRAGSPCEGPDFVSLIVPECNDIAAAQEPPKLRLTTGPAHLGDNGRGGDRDEAELEASAMIRPHLTSGAVSGDQCAGVVDDRHADRRRERLGEAPI